VRVGIVLAVLGIVLAAALGFAAHVVAQDTLGLPAVSLDGGRPLAPEEARRRRPTTTERTTTERTTTERTTTEQETETETETETRTDEDRSGSNSGSGSGGSGDDNSGSSGHGRNRGRGGSDD
jgi:hypothetical protein